jgi:hypothetical protein
MISRWPTVVKERRRCPQAGCRPDNFLDMIQRRIDHRHGLKDCKPPAPAVETRLRWPSLWKGFCVMVHVICKNEDCKAEIPAPEAVQEAADRLDEVLHKKNYYLCPKCGKVNAYSKEDHIV